MTQMQRRAGSADASEPSMGRRRECVSEANRRQDANAPSESVLQCMLQPSSRMHRRASALQQSHRVREPAMFRGHALVQTRQTCCVLQELGALRRQVRSVGKVALRRRGRKALFVSHKDGKTAQVYTSDGKRLGADHKRTTYDGRSADNTGSFSATVSCRSATFGFATSTVGTLPSVRWTGRPPKYSETTVDCTLDHAPTTVATNAPSIPPTGTPQGRRPVLADRRMASWRDRRQARVD